MEEAQAKASARHLRVSPFKCRQVADLVRGKQVKEALAILKYTPKKGSYFIAKVVNSAAANAEHNYDMDKDALYIAEIMIDEGPVLKRMKPRAYGRADQMVHRTSHITVVVKEKED